MSINESLEFIRVFLRGLLDVPRRFLRGSARLLRVPERVVMCLLEVPYGSPGFLRVPQGLNRVP